MTELRVDLKNLMEERGLSLTAVSRALGISTAALSQWLTNQYVGNVAKIDDSVKSFLERQKERLKTPKKKMGFVMTSVAKKVFEVARICHLDGEIGICTGDAGLGKTVAVKEYARQNTDVILIEADMGYTSKVLFLEMHRKFGLDGRGSIHEMFEDVILKFKNSGRLIIIDEAEHLPYRALELLRRIYDKGNIGILLTGMPRLRFNLTGRRGEYQQLFSRIGISVRLENLKSQDTEKLVSEAGINGSGLWKTYQEASKGNTRELCKLITRSMRVADINKMPVNPEIIRETAKMLAV